MDERLIHLEEVIANQAEEILRLSDELYTQQKEIATLRKHLLRTEAKVDAIHDNEGDVNSGLDVSSIPPHY